MQKRTRQIVIGVSVGVVAMIIMTTAVFLLLILRKRHKDQKLREEAVRSHQRQSSGIANGTAFNRNSFRAHSSPETATFDAYDPTLLPLHSHHDPFTERALRRTDPAHLRGNSPSAMMGSPALVPFRESRLQAGDARYTRDGHVTSSSTGGSIDMSPRRDSDTRSRVSRTQSESYATRITYSRQQSHTSTTSNQRGGYSGNNNSRERLTPEERTSERPRLKRMSSTESYELDHRGSRQTTQTHYDWVAPRGNGMSGVEMWRAQSSEFYTGEAEGTTSIDGRLMRGHPDRLDHSGHSSNTKAHGWNGVPARGPASIGSLDTAGVYKIPRVQIPSRLSDVSLSSGEEVFY